MPRSLRAAVSAALDYGIAAIEHGEERSPPIPAMLLIQARLAARAGVNLDTVLRRYLAGHTLFCDFLIDAVEATGRLRADATLLRLWRVQAATFERLIEAVIEEYTRADALIS